MSQGRFYLCRRCGNLVGMIHDAGVPIQCCGEAMEAMTANTTQAAGEKHLPVVSIRDGVVHVAVGENAHPMTQEHSIAWIYLQTAKGGQRKALRSDEAPEARFTLIEDQPVAAYAYCNLHGLWMTALKNDLDTGKAGEYTE